jgi:predicted ArsR family transcriptional regulator
MNFSKSSMGCFGDDSLTKANLFKDSIIDLLNKSSLALMLSLGHRTGLFDAMNRMTPATAREIAQAAGLDVNRVREWLGAMAAGGVVEYDPDGRLYYLPAAHAAVLTRMAQSGNLAALAGLVAIAAAMEDDLVDAFATGQAVPATRRARLQKAVDAERESALVNTSSNRSFRWLPDC